MDLDDDYGLNRTSSLMPEIRERQIRNGHAQQARKEPESPSGPAACDSMTFFPPDNERMSFSTRGLSPRSQTAANEVALTVATFVIGVAASVVTRILFAALEWVAALKLDQLADVRGARHEHANLGRAWAFYVGVGSALVLVASCAVILIPQAQGSGLPQLIAYLNGCKLHGQTSSRVLLAKFMGTVGTVGGGLFVGPEGPIIAMGACVGKQMLRALYHMGNLTPRAGWEWCRAFASFRNDLDQRDFVAIGAGAGIAAAFNAPISGTLFVVEEVSSHFSLPLLWRAFAAT